MDLKINRIGGEFLISIVYLVKKKRQHATTIFVRIKQIKKILVCV